MVQGKRRIQSIDVGFRIIRVLERASGKLPLKTIAAEADMPASKAYLYLASFADLGLVAQDQASQRYGLGPYALQLGLASLRQINVTELAQAPMEELRAKTGFSVHISIWSNQGPVILLKLDTAMRVPLSIQVGYVLPLLSSATGRVFLSHLPASETEALLKQEAERTGQKPSPALLAAILRDGVASSDSLLHDGFAALSAPVFDHAGKIAAALTILGLRKDVDLDLGGRLAREVVAAAHTVSQALGFAQPVHAAPPRDDHQRSKAQSAPRKLNAEKAKA